VSEVWGTFSALVSRRLRIKDSFYDYYIYFYNYSYNCFYIRYCYNELSSGQFPVLRSVRQTLWHRDSGFAKSHLLDVSLCSGDEITMLRNKTMNGGHI